MPRMSKRVAEAIALRQIGSLASADLDDVAWSELGYNFTEQQVEMLHDAAQKVLNSLFIRANKLDPEQREHKKFSQ